jgi:hypothetical protein
MEIKFHMSKVEFSVSEKFLDFFVEYQNVLESSRDPWWGPLASKGPHGPEGGAYMGMVVQSHLAHVAKAKP